MIQPTLRVLLNAQCLMLCCGVLLGQQYRITTVAGGASLSPVPATQASFGSASRAVAQSSGDIVFAAGNAVYRLQRTGDIVRVAGNSRPGYSGDGGQATEAQLNEPRGLALDSQSNLYIADSNNSRIRKISPQGIITTVAGAGRSDFINGDGGLATNAHLFLPHGVAIDLTGNLYIADYTGNVRRVSPDGLITTALDFRQLGVAVDVACDSRGLLFIATARNQVWRSEREGVPTLVAGNGIAGSTGDGGLATNASLWFNESGISIDQNGVLYVAEAEGKRIRRITKEGLIDTIAGGQVGFAGDGGPAIASRFSRPTGVAADRFGNIFVVDQGNGRIRKIDTRGIISTVAGSGAFNFSGDNQLAIEARLGRPRGLTLAPDGTLVISDTFNHRIRRVSGGGFINTIAGDGAMGLPGDVVRASEANLEYPTSIAYDSRGNLLVLQSSPSGSYIRRIAPDGLMTRISGSNSGVGSEGVPALNTDISFASSIAVDKANRIYIARGGNIRRISVDGSIETVVGIGGEPGFSGDGGPALKARLCRADAIAIDDNGTLFIGDSCNFRIRKVTADGVISTVAGNGSGNRNGDGGPAIAAGIGSISALHVTRDGSILFGSDTRVRRISPNGIINTIAGPRADYSGDGGLSTDAGIQLGPWPTGITSDSSGNIYISDSDNDAIRRLTPITSTSYLTAITNAASNRVGVISPGEIIVLYGSGLGPDRLLQNYVNSAGLFGCDLVGTVVRINGVCAPIIYTSSTQVAAIAPFALELGSGGVAVTYLGAVTLPATVQITAASPGIFTLDSSGTGFAACVNQNGSINSVATPARGGEIVACFGTGAGLLTPRATDGKPSVAPLPRPTLPASVRVDGTVVDAPYIGSAPGFVAGLLQFNFQVPSNIQSELPSLELIVGGVVSQSGVKIAVRR